MKKLIVFLATIACVFALLIPAFAEEAQGSEEPLGTVEETVESVEEAEEEEEKTLIDRIAEFWDYNKDSILTVVTSVVIFVLGIYTKFGLSFKVKSNANMLGNLNSTTDAVKNNISTIVVSLNGFVDELNTMQEKVNAASADAAITKESQEKSAKIVEDLMKDYEEMRTQVVTLTTTVLDILTTVYQNSKNLPQGVKDAIQMKTVKALKGNETSKKGE